MNTVEHLVTHKYIVRNFPQNLKSPVYFRKGDTFVPTDSELASFGDRLQPVAVRTIIQTVEAQIEEETEAPGTVAEVVKEFNPSAFSIEKLLGKVKSGELDAKELLEAEVASSDVTRETLVKKLEPYL